MDEVVEMEKRLEAQLADNVQALLEKMEALEVRMVALEEDLAQEKINIPRQIGKEGGEGGRGTEKEAQSEGFTLCTLRVCVLTCTVCGLCMMRESMHTNNRCHFSSPSSPFHLLPRFLIPHPRVNFQHHPFEQRSRTRS